MVAIAGLFAREGARVAPSVEDAAADTAVADDTGCSLPTGVTGSCPEGMIYIPGGCFDRADGRQPRRSTDDRDLYRLL